MKEVKHLLSLTNTGLVKGDWGHVKNLWEEFCSLRQEPNFAGLAQHCSYNRRRVRGYNRNAIILTKAVTCLLQIFLYFNQYQSKNVVI